MELVGGFRVAVVVVPAVGRAGGLFNILPVVVRPVLEAVVFVAVDGVFAAGRAVVVDAVGLFGATDAFDAGDFLVSGVGASLVALAAGASDAGGVAAAGSSVVAIFDTLSKSGGAVL